MDLEFEFLFVCDKPQRFLVDVELLSLASVQKQGGVSFSAAVKLFVCVDARDCVDLRVYGRTSSEGVNL